MTYKFAHFADVHWRGLTRHDEYKRSFEDAFKKLKKEKVDAIFIAGDIVHSKTQGISPELINSLCWWFRNLASIAPTYITLGNHDGLIMNKDREDAISPIIKALDLENLHLIKDTCAVDLNKDIVICNFSCFDEESWPSLKPIDKKINIAVFHGAVNGSQTDIDWEMEGEVNEEFFEGFDFVFLGDIHRHQYIDKDKRIAYCGSTIQQNFGETPNKGFMIWEIKSSDVYKSRHVKVKHDRPYVTISWMGDVSRTLDEAEAYPDQSRFRIKTSVPISQGEIKQIYSSLKEFKNASEIVMKHEVPKNDLILEQSLINKRLNLKDPNVISSMLKSYYEKANLNDSMKSRLEELVHKFWKSASKVDALSGGKWSIKKLEFDNTFGYGKDNILDFNSLEGITGIFGKNRIGKSSICGTLMYTLFNTTDRGSISNLHIINSRKGHCKSTATISKRGRNYRVERQTIKKESRGGKLSASTQLNLLEVDDNGDVVKDLCGDQRRETEKTLRDLIGISDDFLLTAFASQGEMNSFLKQKASARKAVLSKFLELDVFDQLHEVARNESAGVKQLIKNAPDRDYDVSIIDAKNKLSTKSREREATFKLLEKIREKAKQIELALATRPDRDLVTSQDVKEQKDRVEVLSSRKEIQKKLLEQLQESFIEYEEKALKIETFKADFPIDDLKKSLEEQRDLETSVTEIKHKVDKEKQKFKTLEREIEVLNEVPCGTAYPQCKFILNAHKAKKSLSSKNKKINEISEDLSLTKKMLKKILSNDLKEKLEKYNSLLGTLTEINVDKSKTQLDLVEARTQLEKTSEQLISQERSLHKMMTNVASSDAAEQLRQLRTKLRQLKNDEASQEEKYKKLSEDVGLLHSDIEKLIDDKKEFDDLIEQWRVFDLFMQATSKNGIPLEIIRSRLPDINSEIASILQGVTGFTVELESDEGSNDMNIYINYGDSKRIIECCSGMEKMMSAMAIRVALTNVSELSKPDVLIIDEGFGSLDSANIEACSRFLESLKKWFRCILIISHVDAIKDSVDNVLEIEKVGKDAKIIQK
jgi:DNA repair exonuclease SbcCD ATPase subunit/DNA repair exonuclease SbcCD nuclease subunit